MVKEQMTIRLYPETRKRMDSWLEESNSKNRNEFVEKALRFYMGFLGTDDIRLSASVSQRSCFIKVLKPSMLRFT